MVPTIKAIETEYAGCRFRSRLEARWAVFLDRVGARWDYEPEGYELSDGSRYLPDFRLGDDPSYVIEVKGYNDALNDDASRIQRFSDETGSWVLILGPVPQLPREGDIVPFATITHPLVRPGAPLPHQAFFGYSFTGLYVVQTFGFADWSVGTSRLGGFEQAPVIRDAYVAARQARFEHGEHG